MQLAPIRRPKAQQLLILSLSLALALTALLWGLRPSRQALPEGYRYPFAVARAQSAGERFQQEVVFLQERVRNHPGEGMDLAALAGAYLGKARVSGQSAWYLLAQQAAERSLATLPFYNTAAELMLAEVAQAQHDFSGARSILAKVLQEKPADKGAKALQVTIYLAQGQVDQAAKIASQLALHNPSSGSLAALALVEVARGQDERAIANFQKALTLEQADDAYGSAWTRTMLGRLYARRGQLELAQGLFEEALYISKNPLSTLYLADLETRLGQYPAAQRHYNALIAMGEGSASLYDHAALRGLARVARLENRPDAEGLYDRSEAVLRRETATGAFGHRRELAALLLERGRVQDVPEALEQARLEAATRQDWETLEVLVWALYRSGQYAQAQKAARQAMRWGIRDAELYYRAAQVEKALNNDSQAQSYLQAAQETDPRLDSKMRGLLGLE